ncbi:hypothetical protein HNP38_000895 [Chryseobacterium defluvii]|uniref:Uncharacterized protein n=1 Tax=Chryseobacterium defluvii TaxID=160396 RepID=A0A840KDK1_9FLAO|nr:hypothetical protein [Chryseobacterium defluvii]MBB4805623.1 hypothetical protein [Chryseobacterium defluvii]
MKKVLLVCSLAVFGFMSSQDIRLKDDHVFIDKNKCMKYTSRELTSFNTFYSLNGDKLFYIDVAENKRGETYFKIQFNGFDDIITAQATAMNFRKGFINNMIEEGVLDPKNCQVNLSNIKTFKDRYNKNFEDTETTVIINNTPADTRPRNGVNIRIGN